LLTVLAEVRRLPGMAWKLCAKLETLGEENNVMIIRKTFASLVHDTLLVEK